MKQNKTSISDDELDKVVGGHRDGPPKFIPSWYRTSKCPGPEAYDANKCNGCGAKIQRGCYFDTRA